MDDMVRFPHTWKDLVTFLYDYSNFYPPAFSQSVCPYADFHDEQELEKASGRSNFLDVLLSVPIKDQYDLSAGFSLAMEDWIDFQKTQRKNRRSLSMPPIEAPLIDSVPHPQEAKDTIRKSILYRFGKSLAATNTHRYLVPWSNRDLLPGRQGRPFVLYHD